MEVGTLGQSQCGDLFLAALQEINNDLRKYDGMNHGGISEGSELPNHDSLFGRDQMKDGVGCECDGPGVEKPIGKRSIGSTLSANKLSSECFEVKSPRPPLHDVTNAVGPLLTQQTSQGGKWTRLPRATHEVKEKDYVVNKARVCPSVETLDSAAQKRRVACNKGFDQISSVVVV